MNHPTKDQMLAHRRDLAVKRAGILALPPERALAQILADPHPLPLVHAFPEEDLHLLIREIGPDDALPLMAMASHRQLEYLLDQELWQRDRIDLAAACQWLDRLLRAERSPVRLAKWLAEEKTDIVELFLNRSIEVRIREHDQDPSEFGPDFFSFDSVYYIRILPPAMRAPGGEGSAADHPPQDTVRHLLDLLAESDYVRFQAILLEAANMLPAETEEEAYRLRSGRLAEKGFLPFEEAVGLYQPFDQRTLLHRSVRHEPMTPERPDTVSLVPSVALPQGTLFTRALASLDTPEERQTLQEELAALCNRLIVADRQQIHHRQDLAAVVAKAGGYINIGLECRLPPERSETPEAAAVDDLRRFHLEGLFRLGYNEPVRLKQTAERWVAESWFAQRGLPLTFWGEVWLGVLGGLLIKRPLFFDNYRSGTLYRNFASMEDIAWTRGHLEQAQTFDRLLSRWQGPLEVPRARGLLTYKNLLLTMWARRRLGLPEEAGALSMDAFVRFLRDLFRSEAAPHATVRKIDSSLREDFILWLGERSGSSLEHLSTAIGSSLEALFGELEENYGGVHPDHLDPRYVLHFLLEPGSSHPR